MNASANNVIKGPWVGTDPPTRSCKLEVPALEAIDNVKVFKATHIQESLIAIMPMLFSNIELAGFNFDQQQTDETLKDGTLIVEAVKSILFKYYGLYHPLQDVASQIFEEDPEDAGCLTFVKQLDIDLDPIEPIEAVVSEGCEEEE